MRAGGRSESARGAGRLATNVLSFLEVLFAERTTEIHRPLAHPHVQHRSKNLSGVERCVRCSQELGPCVVDLGKRPSLVHLVLSLAIFGV